MKQKESQPNTLKLYITYRILIFHCYVREE